MILNGIIQVRLPVEVVEKLEGLAWAKTKSDAIRTILDSFFAVSEDERKDLLTKASQKKFGTNLE